MNAQPNRPLSPPRLDQTLFGLRWLLLAGMVLLAWLAEEAILSTTDFNYDRLTISFIIGGMANLLFGLTTLFPFMNARAFSLFSAMLDSMLAVLFFWTFDGNTAPLLLMGTLAVVATAFRLGWVGNLLVVTLTSAGSLLVISQFDTFDTEQWVLWGLSMAFLLNFGMLGAVFRESGWAAMGKAPKVEDTRLVEANRLRVTRERVQAISDMATTLSASLNHQDVLAEAQNVGLLSLRDQLDGSVHLISAVMLFQGDDNLLRVVTSRGLTRRDQEVALPGRQGVLGLALQQAEPVFGAEPSRDPELRYFVGFQDTKSVLAIPLRAGIDVYGAMIFGCDQPHAFSSDYAELMTAIGTQSTLALQNAVLYQNLLNEKEKIVEVEEDARKKLSRDLHDGPTQSIAAIAMRVNYTRRMIERQPQQAIEELWKIEDLARRTTKEIRHMLFTLRPLLLETQGLLAALAQLAQKMHDTYDTNVVLKALPDVENYLDTNAQGVLFYVIEEAINNARKHAESHHIWVRLYHRDHYVVIEIEDDGVGFDVGAVDANYEQRGSLGMINMRERAEMIEGTVRIQSAKGRGTKITVIVPIDQTGGRPDGADAAPPLELQSHRTGARSTTSEPATSGPTAPDSATAESPPLFTVQPQSPSPSDVNQQKQPDESIPSDPFARGGTKRRTAPLSPKKLNQLPPKPTPTTAPSDSFANGGFAMDEPPASISKPTKPKRLRELTTPTGAAEKKSPAPPTSPPDRAAPGSTASPTDSKPKPPQQRAPVKPVKPGEKQPPDSTPKPKSEA